MTKEVSRLRRPLNIVQSSRATPIRPEIGGGLLLVTAASCQSLKTVACVPSLPCLYCSTGLPLAPPRAPFPNPDCSHDSIDETYRWYLINVRQPTWPVALLLWTQWRVLQPLLMSCIAGAWSAACAFVSCGLATFDSVTRTAAALDVMHCRCKPVCCLCILGAAGKLQFHLWW